LKISEHEAYWLADIPLIKIWACQERILVIIFSFEVVSTTYKKANKQG